MPAPAPRSSAAPWLLAITLILLGGLAWLYFGQRPAADAAVGLGPRPRSAGAETTAPIDQNGESVARVSTEAALAAKFGGIPIAAGVRLPGQGQLEGRVVERGTRAGVPGARVDLWAIPPAGVNLVSRILRSAKLNPDFVQRVRPVATTGSDASGHFAFEGVRSGNYFLEARAARHVPDAPQQVRVLASGEGGPLDVWVRGGGRVLGRVVHADGRPASGVKVALFQGPGALISSARSGDLRYLDTETDAGGRFTISGVAAGSGYDLAASAPTLCVSHLTDLEVKAGEDLQVELRARAGVRVSGTVLSAVAEASGSAGGTRPLAGAHVGAIPRGLRDLHFAEEILLATHAITDADGHYELAHAPPGEIDVLAIADKHIAGKAPPVRAVDGQAVAATAIVLKQGPLVKGRVVDASGAPIPGVTVRWDLVDWESLHFDLTIAPLLAQAVKGFDYPETDADGRFVAGAFAGDPPHRIDFFKTGYALKSQRWDPEQDGAEITVVLSSGGSIEGIVIDAEKAEPVTTFSISGGPRIDQDGGAPGAMNPFTGAQWVEDPQGRFSVPAIEAGTHTLVFEARGYQSKSMPKLEVKEGQPLKGVIVELEPGATVRGKVVDPDGQPIAAAQVFAQAKDGRGKQRGRRGRGPMAEFGGALDQAPKGALSLLAGVGLLAGESVQSKEDGSFEVLGLAPGTWTLSAQHRDFAFSSSEPLTIADAGLTEGVELRLTKGGGLAGRVTDRHERAIPGAIVVAASPAGLTGSSEGGDLYQGVADAAGDYHIDHMQGGGYFVAVLRGDSALNPLSFLGTLQFDLVSVPGEDTLRYDIVDRSAAACRVYGNVLVGNDPAGAGGIFAMTFEGEGVLGLDVKIAQVRPDGSYEFPGLAAGTYQFRYGGSGRGGDARMTVDVPDQPEYRCDLRLPEGKLAGRVVAREGGIPVPQAEVVLRSMQEQAPTGLLAELIGGDSRGERTYCADDGSFAFERISPGSYVIEVNPPRWGEARGKYAPRAGQDIEIAEGQVESGLELALDPSWSIIGRVVDTGGAPIQGASLLGFAQANPNASPVRDTTDEDGNFELQSLAEGRHDLLINADGYAEQRLGDVRSAQGGTPIEIRLARGVRARVLVRDGHGAPLAGAIGRLLPTGSKSTLTTDSRRAIGGFLKGQGMSGLDGWVDLGFHMPGRYRLEVSRGSARAELDGVQLEEGNETTLSISIP
jgi:protocatechuate 3,4-dioxygenase beta subunit